MFQQGSGLRVVANYVCGSLTAIAPNQDSNIGGLMVRFLFGRGIS